MTLLRWALGLPLVLLSGGLTVLFIFSQGFRRSFGASDNSPWLVILPLAAAALLMAGLFWPGQRNVLHAGAAAAGGLIAWLAFQIVSESATVLWFGILYLIVWLVFYWMAAWPTSVHGGTPS